YDYNIRGWMTDINKNQMPVADLGGKLFAYKIKYNQREGIENPDTVQFPGKNVKPRYNGNIAEVDWRSVRSIGANPPITPKRYGYAYDSLNRLSAGYYQNPNNPNSKENIESLAYDLNGNITNLYRTSVFKAAINTATVIDNLTYTYSGNRLTNIKDSTNNQAGYEGGGNTINYDLNGNMKDMQDKQIVGIGYNHLNLPNSITRGPNFSVNHLYRADGVKLHKRAVELNDGINGTVTTTTDTDYLDGFQYSRMETTGGSSPGGGEEPAGFAMSPMRKAMEIEAFSVETRKISPTPTAKTVDLKFFPTSEGFYDYEKDQYIYQYQDHLGNVRISFGRNSTGALEITDSNDYYPFGMSHLNTGAAFFGPSTYKNYKYNGKELQETGMYDYGARMYMADLGRWGVLDNYSEKYNSLSPYNYVAGNPIKYIDINGEWIYINDQDGTQYRYHNGATQHQVDGKWTNINSSTNLSDYVLQTVAGLNYLDKNTSIGNTMISYFDQAQGNDGKMRDIYFNYTSGASKLQAESSNRIDLKVNERSGVWTTAGKETQYSPLYTTIGHEMGHVYSNFALGETITSDTRFGDKNTTAEIYGTHVENIIRGETYLPLRGNYGETCIGANCISNDKGRLIDSAGGSIYYNINGNVISPIPSVEKVLKVNNTILENRFNYHGAAAFYHWQKFKSRGL
ncbi:hypothetical protein MP478_22200, partial [Chryseobacterium sp. WG14]|uniref:RHS repeat-associated core domain-containing protein n=1 Tax=Chryseobacterium sp. WG14 TaxID=2926909 RepID=UPI0027B8CFCE